MVFSSKCQCCFIPGWQRRHNLVNILQVGGESFSSLSFRSSRGFNMNVLQLVRSRGTHEDLITMVCAKHGRPHRGLLTRMRPRIVGSFDRGQRQVLLEATWLPLADQSRRCKSPKVGAWCVFLCIRQPPVVHRPADSDKFHSQGLQLCTRWMPWIPV